jgi:hypothetical protein
LPLLRKKDKLQEMVFTEKGYFSLGTTDDKQPMKLLRITFGILCLGIAIYWIIFNLLSDKPIGTLWITVGFIFLFGTFQILSGFGLTKTFIELNKNYIRLKMNSVLPTIDISADQIERIELYPFKVHFFLKSGKKYLLRFGISDPGKVDLIKTEIINFADSNNLKSEIVTEEILN